MEVVYPILAVYCHMKWLDCKLGNAYTLYDGEEAYYKQVGNNDYVSIIIALKERLLSKMCILLLHFCFGGVPKIVCTFEGGSDKIVLNGTRRKGGQKPRFLPVRT